MKPHTRPGKAGKEARKAKATEREVAAASGYTKRRFELAQAMQEDVKNMCEQLKWQDDKFRRYVLEAQIRDLELSIAALTAN